MRPFSTLEQTKRGKIAGETEKDGVHVDPFVVSLLLFAIKLTLKINLKAVLRPRE